MKKKIIAAGCSMLLFAALLGGCNTSKKAAEATTEQKDATVTVDYGKGLSDDGRLADVDPAQYVKSCKYKKLDVAKDQVTASDDEINSQISALVQSFTVTDRKVEDGDTVNIDYVGKVDGKEFDGGSAEGYSLVIGSDTFIDGFEDQIIGHTPGDSFDVKVTFPKDYQTEELAGKPAVFETKLNHIVPNLDKDIDDAFVETNLKDSYGFASVKDMKKQVKERLSEQKQYNYILNRIVEESEYTEIPENLVNDRLDLLLEGIEAQMSMQGNSLKDYLTNQGYEDEEAFREAYWTEAEDSVKMFLTVDYIADKEDIHVTDDDVNDYFHGEDISVYTNVYPDSYINRTVLNNLVVEKVMAGAKIK